jgi:hypothetical protein
MTTLVRGMQVSFSRDHDSETYATCVHLGCKVRRPPSKTDGRALARLLGSSMKLQSSLQNETSGTCNRQQSQCRKADDATLSIVHGIFDFRSMYVIRLIQGADS